MKRNPMAQAPHVQVPMLSMSGCALRSLLRSLFAAMALASVVVAAPAVADNNRGHVLLSGYTTRGGSLGPAGASETHVYVFIDEVEGRIDTSLPADATLTLERNGVPLPAFTNIPVAAVMNGAQIDALYTPASEERRLARTRASLDGALADDAAVTALTFATRLAQANGAFAGVALPPVPEPPLDPTEQTLYDLLQLRTWSQLATRVDPNVAVARYRGFIDRAPPVLTAPLEVDVDEGPTAAYTVAPGHVYYRLIVRDSHGRLADLGRIDIALTPHRLPEPTGLSDVSHDQSRCDAPESGRSDGVIALTWQHPGANATEVFAHMQNTTGYDLWRSEAPCTTAGDVDLRAALVAAEASGPDGRLMIPGFVQVNDLPILIRPNPAGGRESEREGWNPAFSQWIDDRVSLTAAGFAPGDSVCYYVVGVDRTGNYGETASLVARVPDLTVPVAPWSVAAVPVSEATPDLTDPGDTYDTDVTTEDAFFLEWRSVEAKTWLADNALGRVGCNTVAAQTTGRLEVADDIAGCDDPRVFNVDVVEYAVYRFTDPEVAAAFVDSDGDGFADADEGQSADTPGAACDPRASGAAQDNYLAVGATVIEIDPDGVRRFRWRDTSPDGPAQSRNGVFWYRVASVGSNGLRSELSAPVRGHFVDKTKPDRPRDLRYGYCGTDVSLALVPNDAYQAADYTGQAHELRFYCVSPTSDEVQTPEEREASAFLRKIQGWLGTYPYVDWEPEPPEPGAPVLFGPARVVQLARDQICPFVDNAGSMNCEVFAEVVDPRGRVLGRVDVDACPFTIETDESCDAGFVSVTAGQVLEKPLRVDIPLAADECAGIATTINDRPYRLATVCGPGTKTVEVPPPDLGRRTTCLTVTKYAGGARTPSTGRALPCVEHQVASLVPPPPRLVALTLDPDSTNGQLTWKPPEQRIGGILVEYWNLKSGKRYSDFFGLESAQVPDSDVVDDLPLEAVLPQGTEEEWCVRAQSVAAATPEDNGGKLSAWTAPYCGARKRTPNVNLPEYLPWPKMKVPTQVADDYDVVYFAANGILGVQIATLSANDPDVPRAPPDTPPEEVGGLCGYQPQACNPATDYCFCGIAENCSTNPSASFLDCNFCGAVNKAMGSQGGFAVYRQARLPDPDGPGPLAADVGPYVQATPYLVGPYCMLDLERNQVVTRVWDPFFAVMALPPAAGQTEISQLAIYFTDRTPFQMGVQYRYQFVYFDENGEPSGYRNTKWKEVPQ